jgi:hypothetical protein
MTRLFCILLTLLFSLSGPAMGANSDFGHSPLAANRVTINTTSGAWEGAAALNSKVGGFQEALAGSGRVAFGRGELSLAEIGNISSGLGREVYVTGVGQTRYLNLSGPTGGRFLLGQDERYILHTHPGSGYWGLQRSALASDFGGLNRIQSRAAVVNESGAWRIYRSNETLSPIFNLGGK